MSDVAMALAKYLNAQTGPDFDWLTMFADGATNSLFVNDLPPTPDEAAALVPYEGQGPLESFGNPYMIRRPRVQVTVRHPYSEIALQRAEAIGKLLGRIKDTTIQTVEFQRVNLVGEPFEIGPDSKNRQRAIVNLSVRYYDS